MKHLRIQNKGILNISLLKLIGASTKTDDPKKIGQFGTGLKYAISYLLRTGNNFRLFIEEEEVIFSIKTRTIGNKEIEEIFCNDESMNITTQYGYQWNAWQIIREIWCNAIDEKNPTKSILDDRHFKVGKKGHTTFLIEVKDDITLVLNNWDKYFINKTIPLYEDDSIAIYENPSDKLLIYKNNILVEKNPYYTSKFLYDFKNCELNELREFKGSVNYDIATALLNSSKEIIKKYIEWYNSEGSNCIELGHSIYFDSAKYDVEKIKEIFQGYIFLHPDSSKKANEKMVYVHKDLYEILQKCGLPCEKINTNSSCGYYGGGGNGYNDSEVTYKEVQNDILTKNIKTIMKKFNREYSFIIGVSLSSTFEVIPNRNKLVFNSELDILSVNDLEPIVLVGLLHSHDTNMYHIMKRLMKVVLRTRNFKNIIFNKN